MKIPIEVPDPMLVQMRARWIQEENDNLHGDIKEYFTTDKPVSEMTPDEFKQTVREWIEELIRSTWND